MKYKILVVDDEPINLRMIERLFRTEYDVVGAISGESALELLLQHDIALIISDQRMPGMTGIEFLQRAAELRQQTVRIILTAYTDVSDLVEAINSRVIYKYITKPWNNDDLRQTVKRGLEHYEATKAQCALAMENSRLKSRLLLTIESLVEAVGSIPVQTNPRLDGHCRRTSKYAELIGRELSLNESEIRQLVTASRLHEIVHLSSSIDRVSEDEAINTDRSRLIKLDFEHGLELISHVPDLEDVSTVIRYQFENYDGSGLFEGLDGDKIPINSRILAVANAYDELNAGTRSAISSTSRKPAEWLQARAGGEFDPKVVEACLSIDLRSHEVYRESTMDSAMA